MNVFVVQVPHRPGELATLLERLAAADINVILAAVPLGDLGTVMLVADDDEAAAAALTGAGYAYAAHPAVKVRAANRPGEGAAFCRTLADAGVNIELLLPIEITPDIGIAVLVVDDEERALQALGDRVVPD